MRLRHATCLPHGPGGVDAAGVGLLASVHAGREGAWTMVGPGTDEFIDLVEIGRGGFGVVYRAKQPAFGRTVAIKVLTYADEHTLRRFERERLALGPVSDHPNIVQVFASGLTTDGMPYLAMEFMQGGSLEDHLREHGASTWESTLEVGIKLAGALETAHRAGITHRDLKPANVLLSQFGEPHLGDFGIATIEGGEQTKSGLITASIHYAPPEVLDGRRPGVTGDVYGLGALLFAILAGGAPFARSGEDSIVALALRVASQPIPDLRPFGVPVEMAALIERAMAKAPGERYPSAEAMGKAMQSLQQAHGLRPTALPVLQAPTNLANATTHFEAPVVGSPVTPSGSVAPAQPVASSSHPRGRPRRRPRLRTRRRQRAGQPPPGHPRTC